MNPRKTRLVTPMLLLVALGVACPPRPRTQLIVRVIAADEETAGPGTHARIRAESLRLRRRIYDPPDAGLLDAGAGTLAIASFIPADPDQDNTLRVVARISRRNGDSTEAVEQTAEVPVEKERSLVLIMSLSFRCVNFMCPFDQTCVVLEDDRVGCRPVARRGVPYDPTLLSARDAEPEGPDVTDATPPPPDHIVDDIVNDIVDVRDEARTVPDATVVDVEDGGDVGPVEDVSDASDVSDAPDAGDDPENCGGTVCENLRGCLAGACSVALTVRSISLHVGGGCALMSDGTLRCWGRSECSEAFLPSSRDARRPSRVRGVRGATAMAASESGLCWTIGRTVRCCGNLNGPLLLDGQRNVDALAGGGQHACVLSDGGVLCAGSNVVGQCGNGTLMTPARATAVALPGAAVGVFAGQNNGCAITAPNGEVYCWGQHGAGQLGAELDAGTCMTTGRLGCPHPQRVGAITSARQVAIEGNDDTAAGACAVNNIGQLYCWGSGAALGQVLTPSRLEVPGAPVDLGGAVARQVARGYRHACVLEDTGRVRCWGSQRSGNLGDGVIEESDRDLPGMSPVQMLDHDSGVTQIEARGEHTCVLRGGTHILCWGANDMGQLGDGTAVPRATPTPVAW